MNDDLGVQEQAVLDLIAANPFAGQQEIADRLGLARSTVAAHIAQLVAKGRLLGRGYVLPQPQRIAVIGGAVLDRKYHARREIIMGTSNPADGHRSFGGVARNIAENLVRLGAAVAFVSIVGDDLTGREILAHLRGLGVDVSQVAVSSGRATAEYAAILDPRNELALGIADMGIFDLLSPAILDRVWPHLASADWVLADCNPPAETLAALVSRRGGARFRLAVNTVSSPKALRLPKDLSGVDLVFTNVDEASAIVSGLDAPARLTPVDAATALRAAGAGAVIVTDGAKGYALADRDGARMMPAVPARPVDITGAGDSMVAGTLARLLAGDTLEQAARAGALLAALTIESEFSVHPELSPRLLEDAAHRIPA
jgi:pseudouridine kinase